MTGYVLLPKGNLPSDDMVICVECMEKDGHWFIKCSDGVWREPEMVMNVKREAGGGVNPHNCVGSHCAICHPRCECHACTQARANQNFGSLANPAIPFVECFQCHHLHAQPVSGCYCCCQAA